MTSNYFVLAKTNAGERWVFPRHAVALKTNPTGIGVILLETGLFIKIDEIRMTTGTFPTNQISEWLQTGDAPDTFFIAIAPARYAWNE